MKKNQGQGSENVIVRRAQQWLLIGDAGCSVVHHG